MDKHDRIQQLHRLLISNKKPVSISTLSEKLECSEKTVKRAIDSLRDYAQAPLEYCETHRGWHYQGEDVGKIQLPGLWLTAEEIHGFAHLLQILTYLDIGEFGDEFKPIEESILRLLETRKLTQVQFANKVRFLPKHRSASASLAFKAISMALMNDHNIVIEYVDYSGRNTTREVSPLKLVHYEEKWYLDAWCHLRQELRSFVLSRILTTLPSKKSVKSIPSAEQEEYFASSYGIFSGKAKHIALLKFCGSAARDAASFQWHKEQEHQWQGSDYLLSVPYNDDRELLRTLLGYGPDVQVLGPASLKKRLLNKAKQIVTHYDPSWGGGKF